MNQPLFCQANGCDAHLLKSRFLCERHNRMLSNRMRRRILDLIPVAGPLISDLHPSRPEWYLCAAEAVEHVALAEKRSYANLYRLNASRIASNREKAKEAEHAHP